MSSHLYLLSNFKIFKEVFGVSLHQSNTEPSGNTLRFMPQHWVFRPQCCGMRDNLKVQHIDGQLYIAIYKMQDTLVYLNLLDIVSLGIGSCIANRYFILFNDIWKATIDFNWQSLVRLSAWRIRLSIVDPSYHSKAYGNLRNSAPLALVAKYLSKM